MLCRLLPLGLACLALAGSLRAAAEPPPAAPAYATVEVAPSKTSIYVGSVAMTTPTFTRRAGVYESTYSAKVFPYFFSSEAGQLSIDISDDQLAALARGEAIDFKGRGVRTDGAERRVEGRATPTDARSGRLKVRVFVSKRIELIFNTTYRFP